MPDMRNKLACSIFLLSGVLSTAAINTALAQTGPVNSTQPVLNAPFSASRHFTEIKNLSDGKTTRTQSKETLARDSQGRTYSSGERSWTYFDGQKNVLKSELLYRIHDPVAHTDIRWDSTTKEVKVIHWPASPSQADAATAALSAALAGEESTDAQPSANIEKLGTRIIGGVTAQGTRTRYTVSGDGSLNDKPIVVNDEKWYCPELRIVVLDKYDDPRSGRIISELSSISRGDPDLTPYHYPPDYKITDVRLPQ